MRKIEVRFANVQTMRFNDWWDFADFLKQRELNKVFTIVLGWRYVDGIR